MVNFCYAKNDLVIEYEIAHILAIRQLLCCKTEIVNHSYTVRLI